MSISPTLFVYLSLVCMLDNHNVFIICTVVYISTIVLMTPNHLMRKMITIQHHKARAIAQAVRLWFPTAAARVRARVCSSGICGGQRRAGVGFLRVVRFPLLIFIPPNSPSSQSPGADTIGQLVADVPDGPSFDSTRHYAN
jgi:hypothetical protein